MNKAKPAPRSAAFQPAHEIRRFESAVWSLYVLSENATLPTQARAACRLAADYAVHNVKPGEPGVNGLIELAIEVGGCETASAPEVLLAFLREVGWSGDPSALDVAPRPLQGPPPRNLVSDQMRKEALDRILAECDRHLRDPKLPPAQGRDYARRLDELRTSQGDVRTKTERAWGLLDALERNEAVRKREPSPSG